MKIAEDILKGYELAKNTLEFAYAPYSRYRVGCALKVAGDDNLYRGCNVENVVYPAGICAEQAAIASLFGRRSSGEIKIQWMIVVTDSSLGDVPCGICQQVISEFAESPQMPIYIANLKEIKGCYSLEEMRPLNYRYPHQHDNI